MDGVAVSSSDVEALIGPLPRVLITAQEAYPVLEALMLGARRTARMGFRIFDPATRLRSAPGRAVGRDWWDLMHHALHRGVDVDLTISDFDPVVGAALHRTTWRSMRRLVALREVAAAEGAPGRLTVTAALHPARVARAARLALWSNIRAEIAERTDWLNGLPRTEAERALAEMPGLAPSIRAGDRYTPRMWPLAELVPATHHQKMAVFDARRLYVGGLDLNERRWDTKDHARPGPETWHDVQVVAEGAVAGDADAHLKRFLGECARRRPVAASGGKLLRTLSRRRGMLAPMTMSPEPMVAELERAHVEGIRRADRFVYLESQFFRARSLANALAEAGRRNGSLHCILVLPAAPEEVAFEGRGKLDMRYGEFLQARCLRKVRRAFGGRFLAVTPARPAPAASGVPERGTLRGADIVYVHAKTAVFDDTRVIVSSANLNGRSFRWDTETGMTFDRPETVRAFRRRLMAHWLPEDAPEACLAPQSAVGAWRALAHANAAKAPAERRGFLLPYDEQPAEEFGVAVPGVPEEMV